MLSIRIRELLLLITGDLFFLYFALFVTLTIRYLSLPDKELLMLHAIPFSILFVVWMLLFFILGLYDQHTRILKARLPERILRAQIGNVVIAALFFFFVPIFGIAPKTNLILYLVISFCLITLWRLTIFPMIWRRTRSKALLIGGGLEFQELTKEVNGNDRYPFYFSDSIFVDHMQDGSLPEKVFVALKDPDLSFIVADLDHKRLVNILPHLYKPLFSDARFIHMSELYEEIFERVPLSVLHDSRLVEVLATPPSRPLYSFYKRIVDIVGGLLMGVVTLIAAPFVWIALRLEGPGPLFIAQERFGERGRRIRSYKFRSMRSNDSASAQWVGEGKNHVTRVGSFLRRTSLDEFPQFLNVLMGELSLIGPRNDTVGLGERLAEEIPSYMVRYAIKPGISGWAQINQLYEPGNISPQSVQETKVRLSYDFYYIKYQSVILDIVIALKTFKRMLFRVSTW